MEPGNPKTTPEPRYVELDSLRGLAAFTVVFHHFQNMWEGQGGGPRWLLLTSPFTAGDSAVILFFLLSGFVLSVPYLRGRGQAYPVYLLRRILRIYAPYLFALALAVGGDAIWHGHLGLGIWADDTWTVPVGGKLVIEHVLMIGNYDWTQFNTAFWSLIIEMRISIVFPFLFLAVDRLHTSTALLCAFAVAIAIAAVISYERTLDHSLHFIEYAAVFVVGIILVKNMERINAWYRGRGLFQRILFFLVSLIFFTAGRRIASLLHARNYLDQWAITLGAVGYIVLALNEPSVRRFLQTRFAQFLGRVSYSLYLVHGTVLFAITHALGQKPGLPIQMTLYVSTSLLLAYLFCILIEEPFLRLSRHVSQMAKRLSAERMAIQQ